VAIVRKASYSSATDTDVASIREQAAGATATSGRGLRSGAVYSSSVLTHTRPNTNTNTSQDPLRAAVEIVEVSGQWSVGSGQWAVDSGPDNGNGIGRPQLLQ
jgi:hypothetical protein